MIDYKIGHKGRKVRVYQVNDEFLTQQELCSKYQISRSTLNARLRRNPEALIEEMLHPAFGRYRKDTKLYTYKGVTKSCAEWAKHCKIDIGTMRNRITRKGIAHAIEPPVIKKVKRKVDWNAPVPAESKTYELENRIKAYKKKGWSDKKIFNKITSGDYHLSRMLSEMNQ